MAKVRDWIGGFLDRHRVRLAPHDWPTAPEEWRAYAGGWLFAFDAEGITEAEAEAASRRLTLDPPSFRREHIPAVVNAVKKARAAAAAAAVPAARAPSPEEVAAEIAELERLAAGDPRATLTRLARAELKGRTAQSCRR